MIFHSHLNWCYHSLTTVLPSVGLEFSNSVDHTWLKTMDLIRAKLDTPLWSVVLLTSLPLLQLEWWELLKGKSYMPGLFQTFPTFFTDLWQDQIPNHSVNSWKRLYGPVLHAHRSTAILVIQIQQNFGPHTDGFGGKWIWMCSGVNLCQISPISDEDGLWKQYQHLLDNFW